MPKITDTPPPAVAAELANLRDVLDRELPPKAIDRNLLIATWNIRGFGDLTEKWEAGPNDSPKRDLHSLRCIAEIVRRFDVIAVQEVRENLKALRHMLKFLGRDWNFILTDVTRGAPGNGERLAFLFDTRRVHLSGLAAELVGPREQLERIGSDALKTQFARTPYAVSFRSGSETFILVTLHVRYGRTAAERVPELRAIAEWLAGWARELNSWGHNLLALGDFNIDRKGDILYDAFTSTGLFVPADLDEVPRTIFSQPDRPKFYDQNAWFIKGGQVPALSLRYLRGGGFDFTRVVMQLRQMSKNRLSWCISDHYPLWAEFSLTP